MKITASASRLYQLTLRAFPRRHRDLYAAEMIDAFERELATRATTVRAWWFVAAACLNVVGMGIVERHRQRRRRLGPAFSTLDFTLAWRMLLRYPGLSIVSVFGMTVGITMAAGAFTVIGAMTNAELPLPEGDGVVSVVNWDVSTNNRELRMLRDFTRVARDHVDRGSQHHPHRAAQPDRGRSSTGDGDGRRDFRVGIPRRPRGGVPRTVSASRR